MDLSPFAWPAAAVAICWIFRDQFSELFRRMTKIGFSGVDLKDLPAQDTAQRGVSESKEVAQISSQTVRNDIMPALKDAYDKITNELQQFVAPDEPAKVLALHAALARARVDFAHFVTYHTIFGSQFRFLRMLNERGAVSRADADFLFSLAREEFSEIHKDRDTDTWVRFLVVKGLVEDRGDLQITPLGRDFLIFQINAGLGDVRYG